MNRIARRSRRTLAAAEADVDRLKSENAAILDVLNAILAHEGGRLVIPSIEIEAAVRRPVNISVLPARGTAPARHVIELVGFESTQRGLMARLGLVRG